MVRSTPRRPSDQRVCISRCSIFALRVFAARDPGRTAISSSNNLFETVTVFTLMVRLIILNYRIARQPSARHSFLFLPFGALSPSLASSNMTNTRLERADRDQRPPYILDAVRR